MPQTSTLIKTMIGSGAMMVMAVAAMIGLKPAGGVEPLPIALGLTVMWAAGAFLCLASALLALTPGINPPRDRRPNAVPKTVPKTPWLTKATIASAAIMLLAATTLFTFKIIDYEPPLLLILAATVLLIAGSMACFVAAFIYMIKPLVQKEETSTSNQPC